MDYFNLEQEDKKFYLGKRYLDSGHFQSAIEIYDNIISTNDKFLGTKDADILIETSLNNRGCAKCGLAKVTENKSLYTDGLYDFQKSIEIGIKQDEELKEGLTAYKNLKYGESEIETFTTEQNDINITFTLKSI